MHKADSIYEDEPDAVYDFPRSYLKPVQEAIGDWVIYYEPVKAGPRVYFAVARIARVIAKPRIEGRFLALIEPGSFLPFDREVARLQRWAADRGGPPPPPEGGGRAPQEGRRPATGCPTPSRGGVRAHRESGLPDDLEPVEATRYDPSAPALPEDQAAFRPPRAGAG